MKTRSQADFVHLKYLVTSAGPQPPGGLINFR